MKKSKSKKVVTFNINKNQGEILKNCYLLTTDDYPKEEVVMLIAPMYNQNKRGVTAPFT